MFPQLQKKYVKINDNFIDLLKICYRSLYKNLSAAVKKLSSTKRYITLGVKYRGNRTLSKYLQPSKPITLLLVTSGTLK